MAARVLKRRCSVCGREIRVTVYPDGSYAGGHYFGKIEVPVGRFRAREVGKMRLLDAEVPVVEIEGEKVEIEYWECDECYYDG